jgi:NADPH-dependent ferric siderophore reductase
MTERKPRGFRLVTVQASNRLTPSMQRLRFTGRDLHHFATDENLHVRLHLPVTTDPDSEVQTRYYTIRSIDAEASWFDVDFVLHEDGPGSNFARRAAPGTVCGVSGPCGLGIKPARHYLLAGDETALPAIARIAEIMPRHARGRILLEIQAPEDRIALDTPQDVDVHWFYRHAAPQAPDFLRDLSTEVAAFKTLQDRFIWIAGEHTAVMPFRPPLRGIPSLCVPYWRRGDD